MKVIHGSLQGLLQEVKDKKGDAVRVAGFVQSDVVADGIPRYTASSRPSICASSQVKGCRLSSRRWA